MKKQELFPKYSDKDLGEFEAVILSRMEAVKLEINYLKESLSDSVDKVDKKWDTEDGSFKTQTTTNNCEESVILNNVNIRKDNTSSPKIVELED